MRTVAGLFVVLVCASGAVGADCNLNGIPDATEGAADCNANGVPDVCDAFPLAFSATTTSAGTSPGAVVAAELTGDRLTDLAVANADTNTVTILAGTGGGAFSVLGTATVGNRPEAIAAGTLSSVVLSLGSTTSLVVANGNGNSVSVLENDGSGGFGDITGSPFAVPNHPNGVAIGDLTGDGEPDIAITERDGGGVVFLVNDGSGGFMGPFLIAPTGMAPRAVALGDMDADGFLDVVVGNRGSGSVVLLHNNAAISLTLAPVGSVADPIDVALADLDADGDLDVAALSGTDGMVHLFRNDGTGVFTAAGAVPAGPGGAALRLADVDGDGAPDVVAIATSGDAVALALNDGTGAFGASVAFALGDGPVGVAASDLDGDGRMDLAATNSLSADVTILRATTAIARDCDANGTLDACEPPGRDCNANGVADACDAASPVAFGATVSTPLATAGPPLAVGDLDGDGRDDVVVRGAGPMLTVLRGLPDGTLALLGTHTLPDDPARVVLVDVDGDGDRDIAVTSTAGSAVFVLRNDGVGGVSGGDTYSLPTTPMAIVVGDFTGDGVTDLVVANIDASASLRVLAGGPGGTLTPGASVSLAARPVELVAGDVDGDGDADLVALIAAGANTALQVVRNDAGTLVAQPPILAQAPPHVIFGLAGGDFDGDGDLDLVVLFMNIRTGIARLIAVPNTGGTYAFGAANGYVQTGGPLAILPGLFASPAVVDVDGDGHPDVVLPGAPGFTAVVARSRGDGTFAPLVSIPVGGRAVAVGAGDMNGDGAPDVVAVTVADVRSVAVAPGLARPAVDTNGNGIPDCDEETRCGDCADDDGDGLVDVADPDCAAGPLTLRQLVVRPAHGRRPARAKIVADVTGAVAFDPATTALGLEVADAVAYCGSPSLRARGRRLMRLGAPDGALESLVIRSGRRGARVRAAIRGPSASAGDAVRVWVTAGGQAFRASGTLRRKKTVLVAS